MGNSQSSGGGGGGGGGGAGGGSSSYPGYSSSYGGNGASSSSSHHHSSPAAALAARATSSLRPRASSSPAISPTTVVDAGTLEPQSHLYASAPGEYSRPVVHRLITERKLAPFYLGLNDFEDDWDAEAVVGALTEAYATADRNLRTAHEAAVSACADADAAVQSTTPGSRKQKEATHTAAKAIHHRDSLAELIKMRNAAHYHPTGAARTELAKRYAGNAVECPICFLFYPTNMVHTRCCDQALCTECFVQIHRPEPTPTHLESEPATCPFCMEPNFGILYERPKPALPATSSAPAATAVRPQLQTVMSSEAVQSFSSGPSSSAVSSTNISRVSSAAPSPPPERQPSPTRRRKSFAHTDTAVVTTDQIYPDWEAKLEAMKATAARRANRRVVFRQVGDRLVPIGITSGRTGELAARGGAGGSTESSTASLDSLRGSLPPDIAAQIAAALDESHHTSGGGASSSRRSRRARNQEVSHLLEQMGLGVSNDLEEMMVMEAMRLSMVEEEERKKKEQQERERQAVRAPPAGETSAQGGEGRDAGSSPAAQPSPAVPSPASASALSPVSVASPASIASPASAASASSSSPPRGATAPQPAPLELPEPVAEVQGSSAPAAKGVESAAAQHVEQHESAA